jgi:hypothetical protein
MMGRWGPEDSLPTTLIPFKTVQAYLASVLDADEILPCGFPAAFAFYALEDLGPRRHLERWALDFQDLLLGPVENEIDKLFPRLAGPIEIPHHYADGFAVLSVEERPRMLPSQAHDHVAFSEGARKRELNAIHPACIVLSDAYDVFVFGAPELRPDLARSSFGGAESGCQSGAFVAMEFDALFPELFVHAHTYSILILNNYTANNNKLNNSIIILARKI